MRSFVAQTVWMRMHLRVFPGWSSALQLLGLVSWRRDDDENDGDEDDDENDDDEDDDENDGDEDDDENDGDEDDDENDDEDEDDERPTMRPAIWTTRTTTIYSKKPAEAFP
jgi:hypothetical protein